MSNKNNIVLVCRTCSDNWHKMWQDENPHAIIRTGDHVKVCISETDNSETRREHVWLKVSDQITRDIYSCNLANEPINLKKAKLHDEYAIRYSDIEDHWPANMSTKDYHERLDKRTQRFLEKYAHKCNENGNNERTLQT